MHTRDGTPKSAATAPGEPNGTSEPTGSIEPTGHLEPSHESAAFVDTNEGLLELARALRGQPFVALDTEFHAERRYSPELMLVQIALPGGQTRVVDALALDLHPLGPALAETTWVVHGGQWDVLLLFEATGALPPRLLDTQLLAALLGFHYPIALADLVEAELDRPLSKGEALSDWSVRPLREEQLAYAAEDSRILLQLAQALSARAGPERLQWAYEEGLARVAEWQAPVDPDEDWVQMDIAARLSPEARRIMSALHHWREGRARAKGVPPRYALSSGVALELARRPPADEAALRANRRIPQGLVKRHARDLVEVVREAQSSVASPPEPLAPALAGTARSLHLWAQLMAPTVSIAAPLLLTPALNRQLAEQGGAALTGWRDQAVGKELRAFLNGHRVIEISGNTAVISNKDP